MVVAAGDAFSSVFWTAVLGLDFAETPLPEAWQHEGHLLHYDLVNGRTLGMKQLGRGASASMERSPAIASSHLPVS
jgi:hypothetical protein